MRKFKILANKKQLNGLGIDYDITGMVGELTHIFPTGFYEVEVSHKRHNIIFVNRFDIPQTMLKEIKDETT